MEQESGWGFGIKQESGPPTKSLGRVTIMDPSTSTTDSDHATHVAGTVGATGVVTNAKGMASKVNINSYDWNSDYTEMTSAGAALATDSSKIPLSNHSYV